MGRWCGGRCQEVGGEELEECCKEKGQLAEASEEGLGSKGAVVSMMMIMMSYILVAQEGLCTLKLVCWLILSVWGVGGLNFVFSSDESSSGSYSKTHVLI